MWERNVGNEEGREGSKMEEGERGGREGGRCGRGRRGRETEVGEERDRGRDGGKGVDGGEERREKGSTHLVSGALAGGETHQLVPRGLPKVEGGLIGVCEARLLRHELVVGQHYKWGLP